MRGLARSFSFFFLSPFFLILKHGTLSTPRLDKGFFFQLITINAVRSLIKTRAFDGRWGWMDSPRLVLVWYFAVASWVTTWFSEDLGGAIIRKVFGIGRLAENEPRV